MNKQEKEQREIKKLRVEVALMMVAENPRLYENTLKSMTHYNASLETPTVKVLREMMKLEPSIGKILSLYLDKVGS